MMGEAYDPIERDGNKSTTAFLILVIISQVLGVLSVGLVGIWLGLYWGGFNWSDSNLIFNYHPLFMVLGLVFLYGDAILVYRVFRSYRKLPIKLLHGLLHILAFVFAAIGLQAVFKMHNLKNIGNMYSLHSWLGIAAVALFAVQWLVGLFAFLVPKIPQRVRGTYLPVHVSFGAFLYVLILGVCVAGITEKNFFSPSYSHLYRREVLGNVAGLCIVLFGGIVSYLVYHPAYRRVEPISPELQALNQ